MSVSACVSPVGRQTSFARPVTGCSLPLHSCYVRQVRRPGANQGLVPLRQASRVIGQQHQKRNRHGVVTTANVASDKHGSKWRSSAVSTLLQGLAAATVLVQPTPAWAGEVIQGVPRVADGDTLQINDQKIRLFGFDAPEKAQLCKNAKGADYSCGLQSGEALQNMIGSNPVRCEVRNKDQYGRNVSSCSVLTHSGPQDIGSYMVSNGYAVAYRQFGKDYVAVEDAAHQAHKGMWQGTFEMPADWRKDQKIEKLLASRGKSLPGAPATGSIGAVPQSLQSAPGPANGCKIKGNINGKGEKIYHLPGSQYYEKTQIDLPQGERWFCTEQQAKEAGWRSAQ